MTTITEKLADIARELVALETDPDRYGGDLGRLAHDARTTLAEYEASVAPAATGKAWTMIHGWHDDFNGTCLQGEMDCSYADLVKVFGKETSKGDEYKVQAEWLIRFPCGTVASIYDYKQGKKYNGSDGIPKTKVRDWHIGGRSFKAAELVRAAMAGVL